MEIIVKRDILDELQAKGLCINPGVADKFFQIMLKELVEGIREHKKVTLQGLGTFSANTGPNKNIKTIPSEEFLTQISESLPVEKTKGRRIVETFVHFIKEMVIKGYEVQLLDFAHVKIEEKKPYVLKTPRKGQSSVVPAKKVLVFEPEKKLCEQVGVQELTFEPEEDFKKYIAHLKSSSLLLLVPTRDFFIEAFEYHFTKAGWNIHTVQNVEEAKSHILKGQVYLVILDSQIPNYQILCEMIKCNKETSFIPMVIMYPKGTDLKKTTDFRICGDEHLLQPFEIKQLIALAESVLAKTMDEKSLFKQELMFQFLTVDKYIDKANEICGKLFGISGLSEDDQISMSAAFREALANAAQHGNKHRRDKMLEVLYLLDKEKIIVSVTDKGFGFDWRKFLTAGKKGDPVGRARQSHREGKLGGLGIMLMLRCVDKLEYNDTGNEVTLTKYIRK